MKTLSILLLLTVLLVSGCCCCCPSGGNTEDWDTSTWDSPQGNECTSDYDCGIDEHCSNGYCY